MKKVLTLLTHGFEETEAVTPLDMLQRAGVQNTIAAVASDGDTLIKGRSGIRIDADTTIEELVKSLGSEEKLTESFDALFLPGGPGTWTLLKDGTAVRIAKAFEEKRELIAAICAAPLILNAAGILNGKRVSAHSCAWDEIPVARNCPPVEFDSMILTSRGAGTAFAFSIEFVAKLCGDDFAKKIAADTMA